LIINICDQGQGISDHDASKIYEPFFTTKSTKETGGLGLGLPISKRLVDAMGGHMSLQNHTEGGAVLKLELPLEIIPMEGEHE